METHTYTHNISHLQDCLKLIAGWEGKHTHKYFPPTRSLKADRRLGMETHTYKHKHFPPTRPLKADRRLGRETYTHKHFPPTRSLKADRRLGRETHTHMYHLTSFSLDLLMPFHNRKILSGLACFLKQIILTEELSTIWAVKHTHTRTHTHTQSKVSSCHQAVTPTQWTGTGMPGHYEPVLANPPGEWTAVWHLLAQFTPGTHWCYSWMGCFPSWHQATNGDTHTHAHAHTASWEGKHAHTSWLLSLSLDLLMPLTEASQ